ncbi:Carboxypeptidase Y [Termitomyces sp. T112]|nr:Carboxypeptidase Y [Termitomyces sp. T112]
MVQLLSGLYHFTAPLFLLVATVSASQKFLRIPNARPKELIASSGGPNRSSHAPFANPKYQFYDDGLFTPFEDLSSLPQNEYTLLTHPAFPAHSVRIKRTNFCDRGVNSYTGYIDIAARHLFFYFFESRNDPDKDDVIFWTNGGPGCSSSLAVFMELGPCRISDGNGTRYFNESWISNANVFFVDQPIGVGYSYADYGEFVGTSEDAAVDVAAFVAIFFENFSKFKGRAFHMAGESYGGRYIPLFASQVYDQNARLVDMGLTPINLTSAIIGNGWTDVLSMILSYYDMMCTAASVPPIADIATCVHLKQLIPRCKKWIKESCIDIFDNINCRAAYDFCDDAFSAPLYATGKNPYDISKDCEGEPGDLCYPVTRHITNFLNSTSTRSLLGVDPSVPTSYSVCSDPVALAFDASNDQQQTATPFHVAALLERKVRVLIYVGTYDWICNWVGNERWTRALEWSGQHEFAGKELSVWEVDGKKAGVKRSAKGLTFATVEGAGHMVPYDKPREALALINRWLAKDEL